VDVLILRTLAPAPLRGYGISRWLRERTGGVLHLKDAALYLALRRLERKGWIENNHRARYYRLTASGRRELAAGTSAWRGFAGAVFRVLEPAPEGSRI
jgi:DNA-binding PadR family transcriptional regulator